MSIQGLEQFRMDLTNFAEVTMPGEFDKFCKKIAEEVLIGVVEKTPVKTGKARGNWQVTEGEPSTVIVLDLDKDGVFTISKGKGVIDATKPFKRVTWITNNVPYIVLLEDGSSKQAPSGMVEVTLEEIKTRAILATW